LKQLSKTLHSSLLSFSLPFFKVFLSQTPSKEKREKSRKGREERREIEFFSSSYSIFYCTIRRVKRMRMTR
jgi:hypothetical protein